MSHWKIWIFVFYKWCDLRQCAIFFVESFDSKKRKDSSSFIHIWNPQFEMFSFKIEVLSIFVKFLTFSWIRLKMEGK